MSTWTLDKCITKFNEQRQMMEEAFGKGIEYKQCLDHDSFGGTCYDPGKVVARNGKVWSLYRKKLIDPKPNANQHGYGRVQVATTGLPYNRESFITVHKLVANYFCSKKPIEIMRSVNEKQGEEIFDLRLDKYGNYQYVQVHHINNKKTDNRAENLQYVYTEVHDLLSALHNRTNPNPQSRNKSLKRLSVMGLENPDDPYLKMMIHLAIQTNSKIYGGIIEDAKALHGYQMQLVVASDPLGGPAYNPTEADVIQLMYYASKFRERE